MYFIETEEELRGKRIAFTHMAQFAEAITIVTEDKGIFVVEQEDDEGFSKETYVYNEPRARKYIFEHRYILGELNKLEIITKEEVHHYNEELRLERERIALEEKARREKWEKEEYERLNKKYG
jgi:ribosomal protein L11 methylase PrmA